MARGVRDRRSPDLGPNDELGTPARYLDVCEVHGVIYRRGERCLVCARGEDPR